MTISTSTVPDAAQLGADSQPIVCHVCASRHLKFLYSVKDSNQDIPGSWRLLACEGCGLGMLDPMPSLEEIASFYDDSFYSPDGKRFNRSVEYARSMYARVRGQTLRFLRPRAGRLLDFGAGAGHFRRAMAEAGWEAFGVDISSQLTKDSVPPPLRMDGPVPRLAFPDDYFDAVTLWHVIEHMPDPRSTLRELNRVLRMGGVLLLSQQNFSSFQARVFGRRWLILDPPRHLFQFAPKSLTMLAEQEGFEHLRIEHSSLELGPFTILQSLLNLLMGNENYLFRMLKASSLSSHAGTHARIMGIISLGLAVCLSPIALVAYLILLAERSGDVFTLYVVKTRDSS